MARRILETTILAAMLGSLSGCAQCQQLVQWKIDRIRDCCDSLGRLCPFGRDTISGWTTPAPAQATVAPAPLVPVPQAAPVAPAPYVPAPQPYQPLPMPSCNPGYMPSYPASCGSQQSANYGGYYGNELVFPIE